MIGKNQTSKIRQNIAMTLFLWAGAVSAASYFGLFRLIPRQSIALFVVIGIVVPVAIYYRRENFYQLINSIGYRRLTLFNAWRIPAGAAFLYYGSQGWLPEQFVANAGYGDIAVGFLALSIFFLPENRAKYVAVQIFGLLDFILAVGTGLTFTVLQVPLMENIAANPIVLIPLFGVPITGALHLMTLDILFRRRNLSAIAQPELADTSANQV